MNDPIVNTEEKVKKCEFPHNDTKLVLQQPIKLVKNDPYPCPECGITLYITVESANMNELLTERIGWYLKIRDKIENDEPK
jgi:hypothetical protein